MIPFPESIRRMAWAASFTALAVPAAAEEPAAPEETAAPALIPAPPAPAGADELASLDTHEGTLGYALGLRIGGRIAADFKAQGTAIDPAALARGLADAVLGASPLLGEDRIATALERFDREMRDRDEAVRAEWASKAKANRAKSAEFLAGNARRRGIRTLPSGLQYEVLEKGSGPQVKPDARVSIHFVGRHADGREFDRTTADRGPVDVELAETIPGWREAVPLMAAGSRWRLFVPPDLAYGDEGRPPQIEPNELLIFELEVVAVPGEPSSRE